MTNGICNIENLDISIYRVVYEEDLANILFHNTKFTHKIGYYKGEVHEIRIDEDSKPTSVLRVEGSAHTVKHFLICLNILRNSGINVHQEQLLGEIGHCFNMMTSVLCYNRESYSSVPQILEHQYIKKYKLSDDVKAFIFEYLNHVFKSSVYAGEDSEGVTYKSIHFCEV